MTPQMPDVPVGTVAPVAPFRLGPNDVEPCGTDSARRRHLAHGRLCALCGITDRGVPA